MFFSFFFFAPRSDGISVAASARMHARAYTPCALNARARLLSVDTCVFWRYYRNGEVESSRRRAPSSRCQTVDFPLSSSAPYITDPPFAPDTMTCVIYHAGPCQRLACVCWGAQWHAYIFVCRCVSVYVRFGVCVCAGPCFPSASEVHSSRVEGRTGVRDEE